MPKYRITVHILGDPEPWNFDFEAPDDSDAHRRAIATEAARDGSGRGALMSAYDWTLARYETVARKGDARDI